MKLEEAIRLIKDNPELASIEPPNAPRAEFTHGGERFMLVEMTWHWEFRWWDVIDSRWLVLDEDQTDLMEVAYPGLVQAYSLAIERADAVRVPPA